MTEPMPHTHATTGHVECRACWDEDKRRQTAKPTPSTTVDLGELRRRIQGSHGTGYIWYPVGEQELLRLLASVTRLTAENQELRIELTNCQQVRDIAIERLKATPPLSGAPQLPEQP